MEKCINEYFEDYAALLKENFKYFYFGPSIIFMTCLISRIHAQQTVFFRFIERYVNSGDSTEYKPMAAPQLPVIEGSHYTFKYVLTDVSQFKDEIKNFAPFDQSTTRLFDVLKRL